MSGDQKPTNILTVDGVSCITLGEHKHILANTRREWRGLTDDEINEIIRMIRAEIDHEILNDTRVPPRWNQMIGDYAVRVKNLDDVIHAIRGEENEY